MNKDFEYIKFEFICGAEIAEILPAYLESYEFEVFEENENGINAFVQSNLYHEDIKTAVDELAEQFDFTYKIVHIPFQNWNAVWESNFQPIVVDDFCGIRADFHEPLQHVEHELVITPKMAFGTGHHETTFMMIQAMRKINFDSKSVFDYGCGSGILAILAARLGATHAVGVDNELPSYESTIENATINGVGDKITSIYGTLEAVEAENFDVILANINRNVILMTLHTLINKSAKSAYLLFSGFIEDDLELMKVAFMDKGLTIEAVNKKGKWCCVVCKK